MSFQVDIFFTIYIGLGHFQLELQMIHTVVLQQNVFCNIDPRIPSIYLLCQIFISVGYLVSLIIY